MMMRRFLFFAPVVALAFTVFALPARADGFVTLDPSLWLVSSTDSNGNYPVYLDVTQVGSAVSGVIPTDAVQSAPEYEVDNYIRTMNSVNGADAAYDGTLLGNLNNVASLAFTFRIDNSTLAQGAPFNASGLVGDTYTGEVGSNAGLRVSFTGPTTDNRWWSNPTVAYVTSMNNGEAVTLTVSFNPSQWSGLYGQMATADLANFEAAVSDVTRMGLSFGSGYFFSNGFAFNTGGTASIQLDSIEATDSTPEPASWVLLLAGLVCMCLGVCRARQRAR
jgi:hypothetical protein